MEGSLSLANFPKGVKSFLAVFVLVLSVGFFTGLLFVNETTEASPQGIHENYLGNEADEEAEVMKFKKSEREMLTTVHTHILSLSFVFVLMGVLVWLSDTSLWLKKFLSIEPLLSVLFTFGGIYLMWKGIGWMKYVVMVSGFLMTLSFTWAAALVLWQLLFKKSGSN
ncbi:hypothetical protein [Sediminicola luteus]|uniref:Uncharacterized protein n=1 Tax=Sediminicola luteus TaxID=319238 RepID=A0A2A4G5N6_9FLAO|nr:hypothetical protein [Sediminicola luteus]PCE64279.1 hypothetical protein B7P33_08225 [Sediminicola luteus]